MMIKKLQIWSGNVEGQLKFYRDLMGLDLVSFNKDSFEVKIGYSNLLFLHREKATPYHIAIHIPDRQEENALNWIKERVPILKNNNEEIVDFSNWNAKSIYFYDADKNIMEFIARRDFRKPESALFTGSSLLGIAEIGMATGNIKSKYEYLNEECELKVFDGNFDKFCAIGDEEGLLITINKNKKKWFPTEDKAFGSEFKIAFSHQGWEQQLKFEKDKLEIY